LIIIYVIADIGSIGGGWLSSTFIKRGWTINRARKTAMLICAIAVTPIMFASQVKNIWVAALIIGLAAAAHQGWSCNLFTTTSDMFPRNASVQSWELAGWPARWVARPWRSARVTFCKAPDRTTRSSLP
jgi:uncharacterized membrane protein YeiH